MTEPTRSDDIVRSWVQSGPEHASAELVERTLRPIPRMRQRRSLRIVFERWSRPVLAGAGAIALVAVLVVGLGAFAGMGGVGGPAPTPSPTISKPTIQLTVAGGSGTGTYTTDPATSLNQCTRAPDGSWRFLYAGGTPFWNIDMLVVPGAPGSNSGGEVAAEIEGPGYVRFDPAILRGGDPPGRSTADVAITSDAMTTTFVVSATTPDRTTGEDGAPVEIDLTVICPN